MNPARQGSLAAACKTGNFEYISGWLNARHNIEVDATAVEEMLGNYDRSGGRGWGDCSWDMWLRNRCKEFGVWLNHSGKIESDNYTVELHVFFIYLDESPSMLEKLVEKTRKRKSDIARSKISKTSLHITPINRTAFDVAPPP